MDDDALVAELMNYICGLTDRLDFHAIRVIGKDRNAAFWWE